MLALVKKPHIEISIHGEHTDELLAWIKKKYDVTVLTDLPEEEFVSIESTEYWQEIEKNRIGNLLAGARLKAGLTQTQVAEKLGIRQNRSAIMSMGGEPIPMPWPNASAKHSRSKKNI